MTTEQQQGLGEERHRKAAHDIPLASILLKYHLGLLYCSYDPSEFGKSHPMAEQADLVIQELEKLGKMLYQQACKEHNGADFLRYYLVDLENYSGVWPPRISDKEEAAQ